MTVLLEWKEKLTRFYGKYEVYILPVLKFVLALAMFLLINQNIGYMKRLAGVPVTLVLSLLCAVLPVNAIVVFAALLCAAHLFALSVEVCAVALVLMLVIACLYFRFAPKDGYYAVLTPLAFSLHIPYIMPISIGLLRNPASIMSVVSGTIMYYFMKSVKENETLLSGTQEEASGPSAISVALNQLFSNKEMYLVLLTLILIAIVVYFVRRLSVNHAWTIAIVTAVLIGLIVLMIGFFALGIKERMIWIAVGNIVSGAIAMIQQFLFFNLDYHRTERVQFEDDEYYYYVKAVPKIYMSGKDKQIRHISHKEKEDKKERISRKALAEEMDIDEELLK